MTSRKNFKNRVRARMEKTGESYASAKLRLDEERAKHLEENEVLDVAFEKELEPEQVAALEAKLARKPGDLATRARLIGSYLFDLKRPGARDSWRRHALWVIRERPSAPIAGTPLVHVRPDSDAEAYEAAKALWRDCLARRPDDPSIVRNAARFFQMAKDPIADELYERMKRHAVDFVRREEREVDPLSEIAMHALGAGRPVEALAAFETVLGRTGAYERWCNLDGAAEAALAAGDPRKARRYATELLDLAPSHRDDWNFGNAIHDGNDILGRLALADGNLVEARARLSLAAETPGSQQLAAYGPGLKLARELLSRGEAEAVMDYLESCKEFWRDGEEQLDQWIAAIRRGETPELKA